MEGNYFSFLQANHQVENRRIVKLTETFSPINNSATGVIRCAYCMKMYGHSGKFVSVFALTWHVTHYHKADIGIVDISSTGTRNFSLGREEFKK